MKYHYTESGLRNIYLLNGYEVVETPYGKATSVVDVEGLHKLIGSNLCRKKHLTGTEFRFIRKEMSLSQSGLGQTLGVTDQAIAKWEKTGRVPKTADRFIRLLYLESINENIKIQSFIDRINETDRDDHLNMEIETTSSGWKKAA
jgi:putative transcriptional regulator